MRFRPPLQETSRLDDLQQALESEPNLVSRVAPALDGTRPFLLRIRRIGGVTEVDAYIDNGELFYQVREDVEWAPVPVGSSALRAAFLVERLEAKEAELSGRPDDRDGCVEWKNSRRGRRKCRYRYPPQGLRDLEELSGLLSRDSRFRVIDPISTRGFRFAILGVEANVAPKRQDLVYRIPALREKEILPAASPQWQRRYLLERVQ